MKWQCYVTLASIPTELSLIPVHVSSLVLILTLNRVRHGLINCCSPLPLFLLFDKDCLVTPSFHPPSAGMHFSQAVAIIQSQVGVIKGVQVLYSDTVSRWHHFNMTTTLTRIPSFLGPLGRGHSD